MSEDVGRDVAGCRGPENQELDADAGSVELTRNPLGLLSALRTLLTAPQNGELPKSLAALCIAPPLRTVAGQPWWRTLLSTHPPLEERIRRVEAMIGYASPQ